MQEDMNSNLLKTITSSDVEELCKNITDCLEQYYHFDGVGFFLLDPESTRTYFHSDVVPKKFVQQLEEILPKLKQNEETADKFLYFAKKQDDLIVFNPQEDPESESIEPMGMAFPLSFREHTMGTLALISRPETIKDLTSQTLALPSFVPVVSGLVANALSHENKDKKIHMLNLYQTVSSSMSYIGDLQELLTTIASIVTSEILCEECSVLFYDAENNEFEFFTAVGETGMELVKDRQSKEPAGDETGKLVKRCYEQGLILMRCGVYHNVIRILVPLVISNEKLEIGFGILEDNFSKIG